MRNNKVSKFGHGFPSPFTWACSLRPPSPSRASLSSLLLHSCLRSSSSLPPSPQALSSPPHHLRSGKVPRCGIASFFSVPLLLHSCYSNPSSLPPSPQAPISPPLFISAPARFPAAPRLPRNTPRAATPPSPLKPISPAHPLRSGPVPRRGTRAEEGSRAAPTAARFPRSIPWACSPLPPSPSRAEGGSSCCSIAATVRLSSLPPSPQAPALFPAAARFPREHPGPPRLHLRKLPSPPLTPPIRQACPLRHAFRGIPARAAASIHLHRASPEHLASPGTVSAPDPSVPLLIFCASVAFLSIC